MIGEESRKEQWCTRDGVYVLRDGVSGDLRISGVLDLGGLPREYGGPTTISTYGTVRHPRTSSRSDTTQIETGGSRNLSPLVTEPTSVR